MKILGRNLTFLLVGKEIIEKLWKTFVKKSRAQDIVHRA
jgi:hypothetical protein